MIADHAPCAQVAHTYVRARYTYVCARARYTYVCARTVHVIVRSHMLHSLQRKWSAGDALTRVCPAKYKGGSCKGFTPVQTSANMMKVPEFLLLANLSHYYELELHIVVPTL